MSSNQELTKPNGDRPQDYFGNGPLLTGWLDFIQPYTGEVNRPERLPATEAGQWEESTTPLSNKQERIFKYLGEGAGAPELPIKLDQGRV